MSPNMIVYSLLTEKKNHLPFSTFFSLISLDDQPIYSNFMGMTTFASWASNKTMERVVARNLFRQINFIHILDCSYSGKIYFLKTDKIFPVEICQKTKVFPDSRYQVVTRMKKGGHDVVL